MENDAILESLECAIVVLDAQLNVLRVNIACETLFNRSRKYLHGASVDQLFPDHDIQRRIRECLENKSRFTVRELSLDLPIGKLLVDLTGSSVSDSNGHAPLVLIEMNSINRISRFVKEQNQLERQQSFKRMIRGLAHEIKNPLGGIRGAAQLLDRELHDPEHKEFTNILIKEADRLTRMVDRVMGLRKQPKPELMNVHEVLEHVVHLVSAKNDTSLFVERFYDPALPEIVADKELLIQAVLNIVGNAIEAQQGCEQIRIGFVTEYARFQTVNQVLYRGVLRIRIWDDGPGVPEHIKDSLFDPLVTARAEGNGLGLSITQTIVQRHKGVVELEKYHGKTCLTICLPYLEKQISEPKNGSKTTTTHEANSE